MAVPTATESAKAATSAPKKGTHQTAESAAPPVKSDPQQQAGGDEGATEDGTAEYEDEYEDDEQYTADGNEEGGDVSAEAKDHINGASGKLNGNANDAAGTAQDTAAQAKDEAENAGQNAGDDDTEEVVPVGKVLDTGDILSNDGSDRVIGSITGKLDPSQLSKAGAVVDNEGDIIDPQSGDVLGSGLLDKLQDTVGGVKDTAGDVVGQATGAVDQLPLLNLQGALSFDNNEVKDSAGNILGQLTEGDPTALAKEQIKGITENGDILKDDGTVLGKVDLKDVSNLVGQNDEKAETGAEGSKDEVSAADGEKSTDDHATGEEQAANDGTAALDDEGAKDLEATGDQKVAEGENADGAEQAAEGEEAESKDGDPEVLYRMKVNSAGKIVNENGDVYGEVIEGDVKKLVGRTIEDKEGNIYEGGKVIGRARAFPEDERQTGGEAPFESFPEARVRRDGSVVSSDGDVVGKVKEGDLKSLEGKVVAADGSIYDSRGNRIGFAERIEDEEPEAEKDQSALAGKRVNKALNVVDDKGSIFGKVVEGGNATIGRMCDGKGNIYNEAGEIIGRAEVVPESQREPAKEGPFAHYEGCVVRKDGKVVFNDEVVGKLTSGDGKQLAGYQVDADGDVLDANGNTLGHAERYEEEEPEKHSHPCAGYKLSAGGFIIDTNGETIGKLTDGKLDQCKGLAVDDDGDIKNNKGQTIGHVTPIQDIQEDEGPPEKTQEELDAEKQAADDEERKKNDAKLARRLAYVIENGIDDIKPLLTDITNKIEYAENTPENERDEEKLVKDVKPLIEEASAKLEEVNKDIRSLDPDGRLQEQAKKHAAEGEASPEEQRVATLLKELTGSVKRTIDNSKKKLNGMPKAKEGINPLWKLLEEPLFQIIAAVGLLLSGVLGLLGKILGGLGLGGILDGLLGGLGVKNIVGGLTGGGGGKKSGGGGGLGGLLGG